MCMYVYMHNACTSNGHQWTHTTYWGHSNWKKVLRGSGWLLALDHHMVQREMSRPIACCFKIWEEADSHPITLFLSVACTEKERKNTRLLSLPLQLREKIKTQAVFLASSSCSTSSSCSFESELILSASSSCSFESKLVLCIVLQRSPMSPCSSSGTSRFGDWDRAWGFCSLLESYTAIHCCFILVDIVVSLWVILGSCWFGFL